MSFRTHIPVRFGEVDQATTVYFANFLHYFHCAWEDFLTAQELGIKRMIGEHGTGFPVVHAEVDFQKPFRLGDTLEIDVWIEHVGDKSIKVAFSARRPGEDADRCTATITMACIDVHTFKSQDIPAVFAELFAQHRAAPQHATT